VTVAGIDISHHQGRPDFSRTKGAGIAFVIHKVTEGAGYVDPNVAANRAAAHRAGLLVGLYHYAGASGPGTVGDPTAEAEFFVRRVGAVTDGEFLVLDWEPRNPPRDPVSWAGTWLNAVHAATGVKPLIYLNQSIMRGHDWTPVVRADYGLWLAKYDGSPAAPAVMHWPAAAMKQYSDRGTVPGVLGGVDLDVFYGDAEQLRAYGRPSAGPIPAPAPSPTPLEDDMYDAQARSEVVGRLDEILGELAGVHAFAAKADPVINDPRGGIIARFAALQGRIDGLTAAIGQLSGGGAVDLDAVTTAADKGVKQALAEIAADISDSKS